MDYLSSLAPQEIQRFNEKTSLFCGNDRYKIPKGNFSNSHDVLSEVTYPDIYNYSVANPSPYSKEDLKAYKSLEAYNQFVCGWVREIVSLEKNDNRLVKAIVNLFIIHLLHSVYIYSGVVHACRRVHWRKLSGWDWD